MTVMVSDHGTRLAFVAESGPVKSGPTGPVAPPLEGRRRTCSIRLAMEDPAMKIDVDEMSDVVKH